MAYVSPNVKTKKELKELVGESKIITVYTSGIGHVPYTGIVFLEGPHYPEPHTWYAEGTMVNGKLVKVK